MAKNDFHKGELPVNYEQKCAVTLVLDTSGSMEGEPITELIGGLKTFTNDVKNDIITSSRLEISIVTFDSKVHVHQTFELIDQVTVPSIKAGGTTKMADGITKGLELLETQKEWYKKTGQRYYRPYLILITDGYPDSDQDMMELKSIISEGSENKKFNFWAFGVLGADMDLLRDISHSFKPQKIKGMEFKKFFKWLSASLSSIAKSKEGDIINIAPKNEEESAFIQRPT